MSDIRYLLRQRQTWYAVVVVPPSLRPLLGRRLKRTLGTRDVHVARARRWRVLADMKQRIAEARSGAPAKAVMTEALEYREALAVASLEGDENSEHSRLTDYVLDRAEHLERTQGLPVAQAFSSVAMSKATPLDAFVDQWLRDGNRAGAPWTEKVQHQHQVSVRRLTEWLTKAGHMPTVEAVTRRVAGLYVSEELLPSGLTQGTVAMAVRSLSAYWRWLERRGVVAEGTVNPWTGQAPHRSKVAERERAFTNQEVTRMLAGGADKVLLEFCLMLALTGARREELGSAKVGDIVDGVWSVKGTKTAAAVRRVPVHSELVEIVRRRCAGRSADNWLFPELTTTAGHGRTDSIGKAFTRYRRRLGIQDGEGRRSLVNMHSWRRWFITAAINAGQPPHLVSAVVGHQEGRKGMTLGVYWGGPDVEALRAVVEAVKLPDVATVGSPQTPPP